MKTTAAHLNSDHMPIPLTLLVTHAISLLLSTPREKSLIKHLTIEIIRITRILSLISKHNSLTAAQATRKYLSHKPMSLQMNF